MMGRRMLASSRRTLLSTLSARLNNTFQERISAECWSRTADDDSLDILAEERMGRDLEKSVYTVCRLHVPALQKVLCRKRCVRDCAEILVCKTQGWQGFRIDQVDDGREDLRRHAGQRETLIAIERLLYIVSVCVQPMRQSFYAPWR